jgi:hypothetical protein
MYRKMFEAIERGEKINAIKALREVYGSYVHSEGKEERYHIGFREGKELVEAIAEYKYPNVRVCECCGGKGQVEGRNPANPFYR